MRGLDGSLGKLYAETKFMMNFSTPHKSAQVEGILLWSVYIILAKAARTCHTTLHTSAEGVQSTASQN